MNKNLLKALFYFTLLLNAVFVLQVFGSLGARELDTFFNSDGLYLPSIYKDLFEDHSGLAGWYLNAAPNFFPEWPLYFMVRFLSGNFKIAGAVYSLMYVLAVNLFTVLIVKRVFNKIGYSYLILINIGFAMFLHQYLLMHYFYETAFLFFVGFHGGAYFMALLSLLLFILYLQNGKIIHLVFLILSVALGALSDRLLIMYFVAPSLLILVLAGYRKYRGKIFISTIASVLATVLGMVIYDNIKHNGFIHIIGLGYKKYNLTQVGSAFGNYVEMLVKMMKAGGVELVIVLLFFMALILGIVFSFYIVFGKGRRSYPFIEQALIIFMAGYLPIVALTPIINGTFLGLGHLRYNYSAFYVAASFFAVALFLIGRRMPLLDKSANVLAVVLVVAATFSAIRNEKNNATPAGLKALSNYYPEDVKRIDELAKEHHLQYGIGNYWFAKKTTMFSKQNVRMYSALEDLRAWFHVTNQNWYFTNKKGKYGNPRFNFILTNDLHPKGDFFEQLQEKSDTLRNGKIEILKTPEFGYKNRKNLYFLKIADEKTE
jgi:hypothetical protein